MKPASAVMAKKIIVTSTREGEKTNSPSRASTRPTTTSATAAANTATSHRSDLIASRSARAALAARLVAAHGVQALRNGRHLEADRHPGELLELRSRVRGVLRAGIEITLHPGA